jgi:PAS domain S-box-containing protein
MPIRLAEEQVKVVRNQTGEIVALAATLSDIGQRLSAERELPDGEKQFREVFEHAPVGVGVQGQNGYYTRVNAAFCRMLGYSEQEMLGIPWEELTHPDDMEISRGMAEQLRARPDTWVEAEKRYIHKNGSAVWMRMRISSVRDGGNASYLVVHAEDITERKKVQTPFTRAKIVSESWPIAVRRCCG